MIEIASHESEDFRVVTEYGDCRIGMIRHSDRFSRFAELEKHNQTDEAFVLLSGAATLYTDKETIPMEQNLVYNVPVGVWHHIVVSEGAVVLVVENKNTTVENSEKRYLNTSEEKYAYK